MTTMKFFGHPSGLSTLFFTEMWERFSYYGMRALLILFMTSSIEQGGLGYSEEMSGAIYGLYVMGVYLLALPGGWVADKVLGLKKTVFYGGCLIAVGQFILVIPNTQTFFLGLLFIVLGTGLLKPNISSLVGQLYKQDEQARRDSGFSIFYMGINIGATIAPLITSYLGEKINWHYGFGVAGIGMVLGLLQYQLTRKNIAEIGNNQETLDPVVRTKNLKILLSVLAVFVVFLVLVYAGIITFNIVAVAESFFYVITGCVSLYFLYVLFFENLTKDEKGSVLVIAFFFIISTLFYFGYEQQGTSLNLFAARYTNMMLGNFLVPSGWMQSVPAAAVIVFTPIFAWLWVALSKKKMNPDIPVKLSMGVLFMAASFGLMAWAASYVTQGTKVHMGWLTTTYILNTLGEICLYPIGLSAVSRLSPKKLVGQMMGIWFMSLALGNLLAGLYGGKFDAKAINENPSLLHDLFAGVSWQLGISGVVVLAIGILLKRWMKPA